MLKYIISGLVVLFGGLPATASTITEVYYSYYSADFHVDRCKDSVVCGSPDDIPFVGEDSGGYHKVASLLIGFVGDLPNTGSSLQSIEGYDPLDKFIRYGYVQGRYDLHNIAFSLNYAWEIVQWSGGFVYDISFDGVSIRSNSYQSRWLPGINLFDAYRPLVDAKYYSSRKGYWEIDSIRCYTEGSGAADIECTQPIAPIPLPASLPLLISAIVGLALLGRRRKISAA